MGTEITPKDKAVCTAATARLGELRRGSEDGDKNEPLYPNVSDEVYSGRPDHWTES